VQLFAQVGSFADPHVAGALLFAVLGPTVFAFSALSYSSQMLKPSINSSYITLQPVLVALLSLALFGTYLDLPECASGAFVLAGLYLTIIGNPCIDREWSEYVADLPTNVPQTIAMVADAGMLAAASVSDTLDDATDRLGDMVSSSGDALEERMDQFSEARVAMQSRLVERFSSNNVDHDRDV
jgi:hypothetical protein